MKKASGHKLLHDLPHCLETDQEEMRRMDQAEHATGISLIGEMMFWQSELKATTALQSGSAVLLCDIPTSDIINGQLPQKLKRCWNDNSIKGADGPRSKCFTKDWVDTIKHISQWLKNDSWCPKRWNFKVLLYCVAKGQEFLNVTWLKNIMKLIETHQYG